MVIQVSKKFRPPKSAINNAKKGLEFRKKYGRGGLTPAEAKSYGIDSGITRAKRIASGKLSAHDVRRMSAFNRHRGNYNPSKKMADGGPTAGTIAWLLWGGTSGVNWAKKKSAAMGAESFEAEMTCPPATQDVAINTKNRNETIKNFGYGPLNVDEPGDFWEDIAKQWKTTVKAAKKSNCGNCVAFDRSPRMKACMPGETSDGDGVLGYCWMHHFKCHSARTCDTWAKGGPITTDKVSEGWQERAFAKPKTSKIATEASKATAKAAESEDDDSTNCGVCEVKIGYDEAIYWENMKYCEECYEVQMIRDIQNYTPDETDCISCGFAISPNDVLVKLVDGLCPDCKAESFEADDDVFTHSVVLGFKFKYYTKQNPLYKKKEDGSFNLDPIHIVKLKILILREMDLVGVEYQDATITADSLLFKFDFTNEMEAQKFSVYAREYLSQNEKVEQLQQYFNKADSRVMTKYEAGILFSTLMDWSNREYLIDFLEYLIKLEEYDYDYSLQFIRERGVDIDEQDDYGVSLKDLMLAEKDGYESMLKELVNDIKNKGRELDDVAFTLSADNGLKNQTMTSMFAIQQAVENGVVNRTMSLQFMRYQGKLQAIDDFLYYVYGDEDSFIFDNI